MIFSVYVTLNTSSSNGDMNITAAVKLVSSPGHTPGHQSVLVDSADHRSLIAAQAAYTAEEYRRGGDLETQAHEGMAKEYLPPIQRLKTLGADVAYFSHDSTVVKAS